MVVLARLGSAELAAIVATAIFLLIMGYLLFAGTEKQPKERKPRR